MDSSKRSPQSHSTTRKQMNKNETEKKKSSPLKGFLLAGLAAVSYSIDAVTVKLIRNIHPVQLSFYRFLALFFLCLPEVIKCGENPLGTKDVRLILILRGVLGGISICCAYTSYHFLPLGESIIIVSSQPIFVTFAACVLLKEPCGIFQSILVVLTAIGIIFTTKIISRLIGNDVTYTTENIYGLIAAVVALVCRTFMMICVRKAKKVHYSVMLFSYGWVTVIGSLILSSIITDFKAHSCGIQCLYILIMGATSYLGQAFLTLALKCEFAGPVAIIMAAGNILLAFLWQIFLFRDIPETFTIIGAVIVGLCIFLASVRRWVSSLSENSIQRRRLKWILI